MKVSQLMTKNVSVADLETTLEEIATMMRDEDAGAIPVLDDEKLVGIVTDRDIVLRCIAEGRDPVGTTSEDILSADLTTIKPNDDVDVAATPKRPAQERPESNLKSRGQRKTTGPQSAERAQSSRGQGISNRSAGTEKRRQHKVVPIRGKVARSTRRKRAS